MKITIITVVRNAVNTIERTICSVLGQTYNNIEYIIVDGLSEDGTSEIIEHYRDRISLYIRERDKGLYDAMNKGLLHASGELIGILNADDFYVKDALETIAELYNKDRPDVIYGNAMIMQDGKELGLFECNEDMLWLRMSIPHPACFISAATYRKYGMFNIKYHIAADYDLILRFKREGAIFKKCDKNIVYFSKGGLSDNNPLLASEEVYDISENSLILSSCNIAIKNKCKSEILEQWIMNRFSACLLSYDEHLYKRYMGIIQNKPQNYSEGINKAIIYGTAYWGKLIYYFLQEYGIETVCFINSSSENEVGFFCNRIVVGIKKLNTMKLERCPIIIASFDHEEEIYKVLERCGKTENIVRLSVWAANDQKTSQM